MRTALGPRNATCHPRELRREHWLAGATCACGDGRAPLTDVLGPDDAVCVVEAPWNVRAEQRLLVALLNAVRRATGVAGLAGVPEAFAAARVAIGPQERLPPVVSTTV